MKGLIASLLINSWKQCCKHLNWSRRFRYIGNSLDIENIYWSFYFPDYPARLLAKTSHYFHKQGINKLSDILDDQGEFISFVQAKQKYHLKQDSQHQWFLLCTFVDEINIPLNILHEDRFKDWHLPGFNGHWGQAPTKFFYALMIPDLKIWERGNKVWKLSKSEAWWSYRFKGIWEASMPLKLNFFFWKLYVGALPSGYRLQKIHANTGTCKRCCIHLEDEFIFFGYALSSEGGGILC